MTPGKTYRYTLKKGMAGSDVWALQILLNQTHDSKLVEDGVFGERETEKAVRAFQSWGMLDPVDGIAGPLTQRKLALTAIRKPQSAYSLPVGLIQGLIEGESGYFVGCVNWAVPGGVDCGLIQDRVYTSEFSEARFREAFGILSIEKTCAKLRARKDGYYGRVGCKTHEAAWECAVLFHNWESAAEKVAAGTFDSWRYVAYDAAGVKRSYGVDEDAWWVMQASGGRLRTARQWKDQYILSKTLYVKTWGA